MKLQNLTWLSGIHLIKFVKRQDGILGMHIWSIETAPRIWNQCRSGLRVTDLKISLFKKKSEMMEFSKGIGLPGKILKSKKAEWVEDISNLELFERNVEARKAGIKSAVAFPIKSRGQSVRGF